MKKIIFTTSIILLFFLFSLAVILSTIGFETDRFSKLISDKIIENNKNVSVNFKEIKFKLDIKNFDLFLETKNPKLI